MKTLLLMRHAKSSKDSKAPDQERPLSKRGEKEAEKMADLLVDKKLFPNYLLASSARRSRETAKPILSRIPGDLTFKTTQALYMAEAPDILSVVHSVDDGPDCLMIVGHNPGLESFLQYLSGEVESLPPAAIACLTLPVDAWRDLTLDIQATQYEIWKPKK
jgi:phosphohistidine phosphatase